MPHKQPIGSNQHKPLKMYTSSIEIKSIKTKKDYRAALKQIEKLWNVPAKSKEAEALEVLSMLVDDYENEHYRIDAPDPIEAIKYRMEQLHLSQQDLAQYLAAYPKY